MTAASRSSPLAYPFGTGPEGHRHYLGFPPKKKRLGRPPASKLAIDGAVRRIVSSNCWPGTKLPRPASPPNTCRRGVDFPLGGHDSFRRHPPPPPQLYRHQQWPLAQPSATSQTKPPTHLPQLHASSLGKRQHRLRTNSRETNQKKTQRVQHPSIGTGHRISKMHWKHSLAQHRSQRHKINFKNQHELCLIKACHGKGGGWGAWVEVRFQVTEYVNPLWCMPVEFVQPSLRFKIGEL